MDARALEEQEQHRWMLLLHLLFAITLVVPIVAVFVEGDPDRWVLALLTAVFAGWYAALFARHHRPGGDGRRLVLYAVGAVVLYVTLLLRESMFILVLYALMPQLFSSLPRWLAGASVATAVLLPPTIGGSVGLNDVYNAVAALALGLVVTLIIESLGERNERQRAVIDELERARADNERLAEQAEISGRAAGVLAERQRLAHDIHDTLAQGFTSVVTQLEAAEQALGTDVDTAARHVARAKRTAREGLREARRTVEALRPASLEHVDLPGALRHLAERWQHDLPRRVEVAVVVDGVAGPVGDDVETAVLRVAQEALTNVARHSAAAAVTLTLSYLDDVLLLDVQDDGCGFAPDDVDGGFGLTSMRERIALVDGELTIESRPGDGTTIAARVPSRAGSALTVATAHDEVRRGIAP